MASKIAAESTLVFVTHGTQLIKILKAIVGVIAILMVNLSYAYSPRSLPVVGSTGKSQVTVGIAALTSFVGSNTGSMSLPTITGFLAMSAMHSPACWIVYSATFWHCFLVASVINARWSREIENDTHFDFLGS